MDLFLENLLNVSDKNGEILHPDIDEIEVSYHDKWDQAALADHCWSAERDELAATPHRTSENGYICLKFITQYCMYVEYAQFNLLVLFYKVHR